MISLDVHSVLAGHIIRNARCNSLGSSGVGEIFPLANLDHHCCARKVCVSAFGPLAIYAWEDMSWERF